MKNCHKLTILVIDDCDEDRYIYRQYLQQDRLYKYDIQEVTTVKQALTWCQQQTADVMLLDYLLPDDDGLEFLQQLRNNLNNQQSAVIMLTGVGDEAIAVNAMKNGAQDYLTKNHLTPEILQRTIHYAVERMLLSRQLEQSQQQQQLMSAIALRIHQSLNLEEILTAATQEVQQFLKADRVLVYQFQPDMNGTIVAESVLPEWKSVIGEQIEDCCFQQEFENGYLQGRKTAINDIYQANLTNCHLQLLEKFAVKANLVVTILVANKLWGLLIVHQCSAARNWQSLELELLEQLAVQIAIAIQQAIAFEQAQAEIAKRQRIEAILRESEARFRHTFEQAAVGIGHVSLTGQFIDVNQRFCDITGYPSPELMTLTFQDITHPDDLWADLAQVQNLLVGCIPTYSMEKRYIHRDGGAVWINLTVSLVRNGLGTPQYFIAVIEDISKRKQIEAALRENEERLSLALEAAGMGNWDWNIPTNEIRWSTNLERVFGIEPGSFNGRIETVVAMIHPDDRQQVLQTIYRAVYEREDYKIEFRFLQPDGTLRWALSRGKVLYDQNGQPLRMSGVDIDITEGKQAEAALRESEARFQAFMNNSPSAAWITDDNGRILYVSKTYLHTFQLPYNKVEDLIGKTVFEIYPTEIAQQFVDNIHHVAQTQQILATVEKVPKLDGVIGDFLVYKFLLPDTSRQLMVGGIAVDISDKIRAEQALQQLNQELEARVAERTSALQESEERWQLALRGSNDGIWDLNLKNNQVFCSARWHEMLGFTNDELPPNRESWSSRIHPDDYDRIMQAVADHLAQKTPFFQEEYQMRCKDDSYIWILDRGQALWNEAGTPIRLSGSVTDITKRKQTQTELLAVTRLQQAILTSIDYAIISTDSQGIIQTFNLAAQKMLGYTADEVIGKLTADTFYDPEELKQRSDELMREMSRDMTLRDLFIAKIQTATYEEECSFIRKDGSRFPVALSLKPMFNQEGEAIGSVGIAKDITQQKHIEAQLRRNASSLATAQRIAHLGSWELDLSTQKLIWSEELFHIFGRHPDLGTPSYQQMLDYIHPEDRHHRNFAVQQAIAKGQAYEIEYRFHRGDGSLGYLISRGEVIVNTDGQPCQLIGTILDITERKQTEEQLRNLSDRLTLALKSANIGTWDWDTIDEAEWDERMYELYDFHRADRVVTYQDWVDRLHPDDRDMAETSLQEALSGIKEFDPEFRIILNDGSIRFIKASAIVQHNQQGEPERMVGINYDITERKQAEAALRDSENRYATLTEAAPVGIFRLDAASNCIYVNERWSVMTARPTQAALGKGWLENIYEQDRIQLLMDCSDPRGKKFDIHETCRCEVKYLRPDGNIAWFYIQIVPEINPSGTIIGYIGTLTDITVRKQIESEVIHHRDLREAIFNESADALFLVDSDNQLIFDCNRRAVELFEVANKDQLINISGNTLLRHPFSVQEWDELMCELNQKSYLVRELEYTTRKGNFFWGSLAAKQISAAGQVINLVRLSDISERKKVLEQIQRSLDEKETLLKEIHHRVKNNLQIISSLLRMQSRRSFDEATLLLFTESQNRVQSMALIHEQLYQSADIHQINFGNYIKSLTDSLFRCYGVSQKNIVLHLETNGIKLILDNAIPCGLIINELVSNSLKYAFGKQQQGNIRISLQETPENELVLMVRDSGVGIPETLDWENANSLGLRIVRNLVRQLKGKIILERDRGTTFYICFPQ
ncbi:PAS domain S-box protein [Anabaena azotica]|uniref:histidine kinase n=1 Tax=Anabaena azotica FACHB-119 TaxID=947527 RepID=A0ABR8DDE2_9NOST|nr:PAS domain S-box protein [Anabaena azotica]MBD2504380.1 PAS domain S-box protein [Anabaena azotica FACHB-119]